MSYRSWLLASRLLRVVVFASLLSMIDGQQYFEGIYCGEDNCYDLLEVTRESSKGEIAKAYRQLARKWHPDMHKTEEDKESAAVMFRKIATAYETLKDEDTRKDYDYMLDHPDEYYFNYYKYYRRRVAPKVDVRIVVAVTISIISVVQYLSAWNNYKFAIDHIVLVPKYRMKAQEIAKSEGLIDNKKKKDRTKTKEELKLEEEEVLKMIIREKMDIRGSYQKPTILDILWLQLVLLPYYIVCYIAWFVHWIWKYNIMRQEYDDEARCYVVRRNLKMSQRQWEALEDHEREEFMELELWRPEKFSVWKKEKEEEKKAEMAQSSRHKMYRRYMKKGGPGQMTFGPE